MTATNPPPSETARLSWLARLAQKRWARWLLVLLVLPTLGLIALGLYIGFVLMEDKPVVYANIEEHFKYGSTGGERASGFPYWIFQALPGVCTHHLPGPGYASLGMIFEEGKDLPVGMSKRRYQGVDRTFLNCAVCHSATVRDSPEAKPHLYLGMPANTFNVWAFQKFLFDCAEDPQSAAEYVVPEIDRLMRDKGERLGLVERYLLYPVAIALVRERLLMLRGRFAPLLPYPEWGPGRVDTFNAAKVLFNFPLGALSEQEKNAPSDFPSIWLQQPRKGMQLHWDGNNTVVEERNKSAAFGTGTTPPTIDLVAIGRIEEWLLTREPAKYPYPIDSSRAGRGEAIYKQFCASCHGANGRNFSGDLVGKVTPLKEIGTDPRRLDSYTYDLAVNQATLYAGYDWRFKHFRKTFGYANLPLDGVWLRAPYLHNGSVPSLRDLLEPATKRTPVFYRGDDVYDPTNVGFVSNVSERGGRQFFKFDTSVPGNENIGHEGEPYGTELPPEAKEALLEYLKTF
jgi:mono/diheme cytochrome c family protein